MSRRRRRLLHAAAIAAFSAGLDPAACPGQVVVKVNDTVFFQMGAQLQFWAEELQDPVSGGYSQNFYLRRVRLLLAGKIGPDVGFFLMTEDPRLGSAGTGTTTPTRNLAAGFSLQDAFGEWRIAGDKAILSSGLILLPGSRNIVTGSSSQLAFDYSAYSLQAGGLTQTYSGRDVGLHLRGYLLDDRLEYRAGVFSGKRDPATSTGAGSRNPPQYAARLQYDVFDPEKGYIYTGTNRGLRKILALGAWGNVQGDFRSWGADATADIPLAAGSAATVSAQYYFYDGGKEFLLLPRQHAFFVEAGYYFAPTALQPFGRVEGLDYSDSALESREQKRWGAGFNWYIAGQNAKLSALYERILPKVALPGATRKNTAHLAVQLQFFYY